MRPYHEIPTFEHAYLEDSWVLGLRVEPGYVLIDLELALTEDHPNYKPPASAEAYCYVRARISFNSVKTVSWTDMGTAGPTRDLDGSIDFGNIDTFTFAEKSFKLTGDFGTLQIESHSCALDIES